MLRHVQEFVSRFKTYSKRLDNFALLLDQPWVTRVDEENTRCVFLFRRKNNDLIMSFNGRVEKARWEFIPSMNSLLIERKDETILYNQGFFDESIMILRRDGSDQWQVFANENKIDSTIENLLSRVERKYTLKGAIPNARKSIRTVKKPLTDGRIMEIFSSLESGYTVGDEVLIDGKVPPNGKYKFSWFDSIVIENGKIKRL